MILNDAWIKTQCLHGSLITPYAERQVQPASYDARLGNEFRVFTHQHVPGVDLKDPSSYEDMTRLVRIADEDRFVLHPGEFALGVTMEKLDMPDDVVGRIEGKSSLGRLGLIVHATAGFIDPGFRGPVTMEMTNLLRTPIILYPGLLICQFSFTQMQMPAVNPYDGRYQDDKSVAPSRYEA